MESLNVWDYLSYYFGFRVFNNTTKEPKTLF